MTGISRAGIEAILWKDHGHKLRDGKDFKCRTCARRAALIWDTVESDILERAYLLHGIWLYVNWHYVTKQLTTSQKNLWADAVELASARLDDTETGVTVDRWWE